MNRKLVIGLVTALVAAGIAVVVVLAAFHWVKENFALKGADFLAYPGGVSFSATSGGDYTHVTWYAADRKAPEVCPMIVHMADEDLDDDQLGDFDRLKGKGWGEREVDGEITELKSPEGTVLCWFREKELIYVGVTVISLHGSKVPQVSITVFGKKLSLPASERAIIRALGPPERKWSLG